MYYLCEERQSQVRMRQRSQILRVQLHESCRHDFPSNPLNFSPFFYYFSFDLKILSDPFSFYIFKAIILIINFYF